MNIMPPILARPAPHSARRDSPSAPVRRAPTAAQRVILGTLLALTVLTGCGVRLESPAVVELAPDADEISRQAMVSDALAISDQASQALLVVPADAPEAIVLQQVADFAMLHVEMLGGEYVSGIGHTGESGESAADTSPQTSLAPGALAEEGLAGPSDTQNTNDADRAPDPAATSVPATPSTVVSLLEQSSARTRGSLATPVDGSLARLYASIATSQLESARALAATTGTEAVLPEAFGTSLPASLPANVSAAELATLVRSEDSAGYAYEVAAARLPADARTLSLTRAAVHRDRGQEWAELSSVAETTKDPRQVAYALPAAVDGAAPLSSVELIVPFAAQVESTLTTTYTTLVGHVGPEERAVFLDLAVDAYATARAFGAPLQAFPGMPEQL